MTKYYKVWLSEKIGSYEIFCKSPDDNNYIICRYYPFLSALRSKFVFKEIVTNKVVLESSEIPKRNLTCMMQMKQNENEQFLPYVKPISKEEVQLWLRSMSIDDLKKYVDRINSLEEIAIKHYDIEHQRQNMIKRRKK